MALRDIVAGIYQGLGGDPFAAARMQLAKQALQMQMEEAKSRKEMHDLQAKQLQIHMKMLERQERGLDQPISDYLKPETSTVNQPTEQGGPQEGEAPTAQVNTGKYLFKTPENATVGDIEPINKIRDFFIKSGIVTPPSEGFTGTLKPGETHFERGKPVASLAKEEKPSDYETLVDDQGNLQPHKKGTAIPKGWTKQSEKDTADMKNFQNYAEKAGLDISQPANFKKYYDAWKTLGAAEYGKQRLEVLLKMPQDYYDTNTGNYETLEKGEVTRANKENEKAGLGSRYIGANTAGKVKSKLATFNEIGASAQLARQALNELPGDFSQTQMAKFANVLGTEDDGSTLRNFIGGNIFKTLTPAEQNYVAAIKNLRESAYAMRQVQGLGQGSDLVRKAIDGLIPGPRTPNKAYANRTLDLFETELENLKAGIPGLGAEGKGAAPITKPTGTPFPLTGKTKPNISDFAKTLDVTKITSMKQAFKDAGYSDAEIERFARSK